MKTQNEIEQRINYNEERINELDLSLSTLDETEHVDEIIKINEEMQELVDENAILEWVLL